MITATLREVADTVSKIYYSYIKYNFTDFVPDIRVYFEVQGIPATMLVSYYDNYAELETGDSEDGPTNDPKDLEIVENYIENTSWDTIECDISDGDYELLDSLCEGLTDMTSEAAELKTAISKLLGDIE